jgi:hypothetical protein
MATAQNPLRPVEHIVDMWFENVNAWVDIQRTWTKMFLRQPSVLAPGMNALAEYTANGPGVNGRARDAEPAGAR